MSVAQVIRFDERQAIARPRRKQAPAPFVLLKLPVRPRTLAVSSMTIDDDRIAGRGRDPG